jgi:hypothetical protein
MFSPWEHCLGRVGAVIIDVEAVSDSSPWREPTCDGEGAMDRHEPKASSVVVCTGHCGVQLGLVGGHSTETPEALESDAVRLLELSPIRGRRSA